MSKSKRAEVTREFVLDCAINYYAMLCHAMLFEIMLYEILKNQGKEKKTIITKRVNPPSR